MEINKSNINEIVNKSNARPDKDYGQNFLIEPSICEEIVNALSIKEQDNVLEIGPGLGSLTHFIAKTANSFTAVDIDNRMTSFLSVVYKDFQNFTIINEDIRKVDIANFSKIIGNLPYNITTELVNYLIIEGKAAKRYVLMCQNEAYPRFSELCGKEYGPSAILINLIGKIYKLRNVKAGSFYPVPKCGSLVFVIDVDESKDRETAIKVYKLAKQLFLNRRKTIYNNLTNYLKNRELASSILERVNISPNLRPEDIKPEKYVALYDEINKII